jgi:hypothetical protein
MIDVVLDVSGIYGLGPSHEAVRAAAAAINAKERGQEPDQALISQSSGAGATMIDQDSAYDCESASIIRLSNGMVRVTVPFSFFCELLRLDTLLKSVFFINSKKRFFISKKWIQCWRWFA